MNKKALSSEVIKMYDLITAFEKLEKENEELRGMVTALQAILDNQVLEETIKHPTPAKLAKAGRCEDALLAQLILGNYENK
jgi:hypothetical protein